MLLSKINDRIKVINHLNSFTDKKASNSSNLKKVKLDSKQDLIEGTTLKSKKNNTKNLNAKIKPLKKDTESQEEEK